MVMKTSRDPDLLNYIYETGHEELVSNGPNCHQCMNELFQEKKLRDVQTVFVLTPKGPVAFLIGSLKFAYGRETPFTMTAIAQDFLLLRCTLCAQKSVRSQLEETKKEINDDTVKAANRKRGTDHCSSEEASDVPTSCSTCKKAKATTEKMTANEPTTLKKVECLIINSSARKQACYAMDFELNEHSFGSLKDFGDGSMNFKSVLDQFSYIGKVEFNSFLLDKKTYKVLMESNAEIGYLTVLDSILDFDVNDFILLCQRFKGSSFNFKFSESNPIWSDEILAKVLPFTSIRIPLVSETTAMEQSAQLITDKTLAVLVDGEKFPQVFDIGNTCNSFSIKAIVKILMTLRERGEINNYLNWNLGILPSDQFYEAARLYDENDPRISGFKMTSYRGYKDKAEITYEIAVGLSGGYSFVRYRIRQ